jgi:16S rRNA (guanine966-N2)-methyltransferase
MRIIAGEWRGRRLHSLQDEGIRPTGDRAKSSLFNILTNSSRYAPWPIQGGTVLDTFSGTGSIGLECLSRGAKTAFFMERDRNSLTLLQRNIQLLGAEQKATVLQKDATRPGQPLVNADLVFLDPPYYTDLAEKTLEAFVSTGWISAQALVIVETSAQTQLATPKTLQRLDFRQYGNTSFWFLTRTNPPS